MRALVLTLWIVAIASPALAQGGGSISGIVDVAGPDAQPFTLPGVTLTLTCPASRDPATGPSDVTVRVAVTDAEGAYHIADVSPGSCSIVAELEGFQSATKAVEIESQQDLDVPLRLGFKTLREDVIVTATGPAALEMTGSCIDRVEHTTLQTTPTANERFQDALPLLPGVVRGPDGLLNINGSRSNQTGLTVNKASGTDPVTGEFALEIPVDAIQTVQVQHTAYAARASSHLARSATSA